MRIHCLDLLCEDLCVEVGRKRILDGASYRFPSGQIVGIVGSNGAGKTTLLDAISGFAGLTAGTVTLGKTSLRSGDPITAARLGFRRTFQDLRLVWSHSVRDNVLISLPCDREAGIQGLLTDLGGRASDAEARARCEAILRDIGQTTLGGQLPLVLSYGQRKLLSCAMLAASEPTVALLDEPAVGLDAPARERVVSILRILRTRGVVVIVVEHDRPFLNGVADRIVTMAEGRLVAQ